MITYGFIMPDGKETDMDGRTHAEYMKEYEQAGFHVDFLSAIWWDSLEQPPEKWFQI